MNEILSRSRKLRVISLLAFVTVLLLAWGIAKFRGVALTGAGYIAKVSCSSIFVSGRDLDSVKHAELALDNPLTSLQSTVVDTKAKKVVASITPLASRTAIYRPGLGCTLISELSEDEVRAEGQPLEDPLPPPNLSVPWPDGEASAPDSGNAAMNAALDWAFAEPDPKAPRRTRAVLVVHDGAIVAERYGAGANVAMPLQGWSMTKTVDEALVGILVERGKLRVNEPAPVAEWKKEGDPRGAITLDELLRMSSGLRFQEAYGDLNSDVTQMLFRRAGAGAYAASLPLAHPPDTFWDYSSGTANIIARIVREAVGGSLPDYWAFPRKVLFDPIGARSAVMEPDSSGVFVGSSFMYATARDWARLGLLYLNDGVWNGQRILPEGWVKYTTTPTPKAPLGQYGAQIWLNAGEPGAPEKRTFPNIPADTYWFDGFEGQHVIMIPSRKLVIVRLGVSQAPQSWDMGKFLERVLGAVG
jgi:CubicO group peptidase (beta-lactamase class C family)